MRELEEHDRQRALNICLLERWKVANEEGWIDLGQRVHLHGRTAVENMDGVRTGQFQVVSLPNFGESPPEGGWPNMCNKTPL